MGPAIPRHACALLCALLLSLVLAGLARAADPVDSTFGVEGIAQIEARVKAEVGGIADLEPGGGGSMLAAVYPIARKGHFFAAARIGRDGALDRSFGRDGLTPHIGVYRRKGETEGGVLQAEAVAGMKDGRVLLAGYFENSGAFAPALAEFTRKGRLDHGFGHDGRVVPHPSYMGTRVEYSGGERLHDVAVERDGTIVGVGDLVPEPGYSRSPGRRRAGGVVIAYRPDGQVDRDFGHDGRFQVLTRPDHAYSPYTGFTEVKALPSGKLLVSGYIHERFVLYRLTDDGRIDRSFGNEGRVVFAKPGKRAVSYTSFFLAPIAVDPHGRIVLAAPLFPEGSEEPIAFVRLLPDGRRDRSFGRSIYMERAPADAAEPSPREHGVQSFQFEPLAIAIDGRGRIVVTGGEVAPYTRGQEEPGHEDFTTRRFLPDGRRDRTFGNGGVWHTDPPGSQSLGRAATTQPDGQVVAGGWVQIERFGGNGPGNTALMLTRFR